MTSTPYVSLILPAFNEAGSIQNTIAEAVEYFDSRGYRYEIIVAADGTDGTREIVANLARQNPSLNVLGDPRRLGKGRGVRLAVKLAKGEIVGFADADNKVPITEFDKVHNAFQSGYDAVIGSRAKAESNILRKQPLYRQIGARGFALALRLVTGLYGFKDTQCGFKFFRGEAAHRIFRAQRIDGYMFDVEILALVRHFGYRAVELPIAWRDDGDSRLELVRGNIRNARDLFRIRRSLRELQREPERVVVKTTVP